MHVSYGGAYSHVVAVPGDCGSACVSLGATRPTSRRWPTYITQCPITTVAMEVTGVYWIGLFQLLQARAFDVIVVNSQLIKQVSGRKTDVSDSQWIQPLHSYGLLPEHRRCPSNTV